MRLNIKALINKANGQVTANFPKRSLPKKLLTLIKADPKAARFLKIKLEGFS